MAVKITKLKTEKVRAIVPVIVEGTKEEIKIFNPTPEQKIYFFERLEDKLNNALDEEGKFVISGEDVIKTFYRELTDLIIEDEDEMLEILLNPSKEILEVAQHINQIVHELVLEMMINKQMELNKIKEYKKQSELVETTREILKSVGIDENEFEGKEVELDTDIIKPLSEVVEKGTK